MHRSGAEAIYAFRSQDGDWFGPHTALKSHVARVLAELGVRDRVQTTVFC